MALPKEDDDEDEDTNSRKFVIFRPFLIPDDPKISPKNLSWPLMTPNDL